MKTFLFLVREIWSGQSAIRSFLNQRLREETLSGATCDIGGGYSAKYISFMKRESDVTFINFDKKAGATVDFEKDQLPFETDSCDTVLFLNVMEHIFNHQHIANEVVRILKPEGKLIGFVPFLMWYHPDHRDFFRYTHEALEIIFTKAGANNVRVESIALGPFIAATQMIMFSFPKILRIFVFAIAYLLDTLFLRLRPNNRGRYALGYYFTLVK